MKTAFIAILPLCAALASFNAEARMNGAFEQARKEGW